MGAGGRGVVQEERTRRSVQEADDEDYSIWTEACEGIARTMLEGFGGQRSHEGQRERTEGTNPVSE